MAESLKKGIGTKYLLPIVAAYAGAGALLGVQGVVQVQALARHLAVAGLAGVILLVLQDLIPRPAKEVLVFWRLRHRVPGCRAFSEIAPQDDRVDPTDLAVLLPPGPMSPKEQNALWYRWLKSVESDPAIADNHFRFLALRDCAVLLFLLTAATPFLALSGLSSPRGAPLLGVTCFGCYVLTAIAARNAAVRLVSNVIARKVGTS